MPDPATLHEVGNIISALGALATGIAGVLTALAVLHNRKPPDGSKP